MQQLSKLLKIENSELARLLRFNLYGIEASLQKARIEFPQDPGIEICDEMLRELHSLLQITAEVTPPDTLEIIPPPEEPKLTHLRQAFDADKELHSYLGNSPLSSQTDSDLWNEIQRKLLRIPEDVATSWRQIALKMAQQAGAIADNSNLYQLPFIRDEIIYPGLSGSIRAKGLCLSKKVLANEEITQTNASGELHLLAALVLICIKLIDAEPDLHHALKSVFSFDIISLHSKPEQRHHYIEALIDRFQRTQKADETIDPLSSLRAWIDMDEAIHSLVFIPPADRYSWWGKLQHESRRILKKVMDRAIASGYDVRVRQLSGLYADVCTLSKDDLQLDCGGTPGEVLSCLRVYMRINQEESPGRVIFRSSR
jgi:hypothetical protein